jgi:hypothetical protein
MNATKIETACVVRIGKSGKELHLGRKTTFRSPQGMHGYNVYSACSTRSNRPSYCSFAGEDLSKVTCERCKKILEIRNARLDTLPPL